MPNGTDCAAILQTEAVCVPTQWFIIDCTTSGRAAQWLRADLGNAIDYLHLTAHHDVDAAAAKATLIALRPKALHALYEAHDRRVREGTKGRLVVWVIADLAEPLGNRLLAELPLDVAQAMFWKTGTVPAVIRAAVGGDESDRVQYLKAVRDQYFSMPDFSLPYYGNHEAGRLYANEFDSTLLSPTDEELRAVVEHLVPLHVDESHFAKAHLQRHSAGGIFVIEEVMGQSLRWRKIDWLAVTAYPYFRRLWQLPQDDVLELLDYRRCPARAKDPWAALKDRQREKDWHHLDLDGAANVLLEGEEQAYRVTPGDHETRLLLVEFIARHQLHADVLRQCEVGRLEAGPDADPRWIKAQALAYHGLGDEPRAKGLLTEYRQRLQSRSDPSAQTLDEIGSIALMEGDFATALSGGSLPMIETYTG